jgi:hypothetical protein
MAKFPFQPIPECDLYRAMRDDYAEAIRELDPSNPEHLQTLQNVDERLRSLLFRDWKRGPKLPKKELDQRRAIHLEGRAIKGREGKDAAVKFVREQIKTISSRNVKMDADNSIKRWLNFIKPR